MDVVVAKPMKSASGLLIFIFASVLLNGCSAAGAPSFELFGAFFPAWLFCGLIGLVASGAARGLFVGTGLSHLVPYQLFVCVAIGVIAACLAWLLSFGW
jgi:YtcA family